MNCAPIALFVYNRPWHTRQTVEALLKNELARVSELYVFSDSPKRAANEAVAEVRDYVSSIKGFKSVTVVERAYNWGLAKSIVDGVTRLSKQFDRVIVLEDDLATSPHFLTYMNEALNRYAQEGRVMQIAGYMFPGRLEVEDDAVFLPFISSWGWATWHRAWQCFDHDVTGYDRLLSDAALRREFDLDGHYPYFRILKAQQRGKVDSWAIRWYLSVFLRKGLALFPRKTLVRNIGFDGSGVNCTVSDIKQDTVDDAFRPMSLPGSVQISPQTNAVFRNIPVSKPSIVSMLNRAKNLMISR